MAPQRQAVITTLLLLHCACSLGFVLRTSSESQRSEEEQQPVSDTKALEHIFQEEAPKEQLESIFTPSEAERDEVDEEEKAEAAAAPSSVQNLSNDEVEQLLRDVQRIEEEPDEDDADFVLQQQPPQTPMKKKRSMKMQEEGPNTSLMLARLLQLQEEENNQLSKALDLATLAQLSDQPQLVEKEVDVLKGAIETEQEANALKIRLGLQDLLKPDDDDDDVQEAEDVADEALLEDVEKRSQEEEEEDDNLDESAKQRFLNYMLMKELEEEEEEEKQRPVPVDTLPEPDQELEEDRPPHETQEREETQLNPFYRELWKAYREARPEEEEQEEEEEEEEEPSADEAALVTVLSNMSPQDRRLLEGELERSIARKQREQCPALRLDNCAFLSNMDGAEPDDEAIALCNRHQLCYSCGAAFGLSRGSCDAGYLAETRQSCAGDAQCESEATLLFTLMLQQHRFQAAPAGDCRAPCVLDFIVNK